MFFIDCKMVDVLRGRRRLRVSVCKLPCPFCFLLLFAVGGLVLFVHLQDLSDMVIQQTPGIINTTLAGKQQDFMQHSEISSSINNTGVKLRSASYSTKCAQFSESAGRVSQRSEEGDINPISPMQLPDFHGKHQSATPGSREHDLESQRVTKRHRKLLKTSPVVRAQTNSSSSPSYATAESSTGLYDIQESRRRIIREVCAKYRSNISRTITPHHVSRIYVEERHKLLYCEVPKAGCSNWKRVLMVLAGVANSTGKINDKAAHYDNHLKRLDSFDRQGIAKRLKTYTKVLFVREPLERLVSAFRDKFENPNFYYHPVFGKPIISKYRVNASKAALKTGSGVTFREFIHYLLDVHRPVGMDIHWEPVNQLCYPCHLHYDYIGKIENLKEEANMFLRKIRAPEHLMYPSVKARTSTQITQDYFSQLNASERQRTYDFFYMDYLMFNYSKPYKDLY
nr:carbohydrate sulfotransferase 8 isoform X1 [Misgurnus anguillicaudatus]XP_055029454.1 carbohydrate sulfotransferase 8 isoform X1 [Misgurnus anguillicaudatus]XP_055029455.1 carbohydrate sulfotransferase 8 isoform X1 [Misgurnus anguillicaudatus]XP_055029456.1 carbohydrate sulfotransferase 8 isoform X1 [Misgurnus anguillicaudatus]XP_055029457.1 carbohydrate sulfotransferase 8 isoform X1 [Misgurnus anguillicaudatus]XP_055029458.1 carbohydrate sulfotransferase 8 isoform X1 [Misgurnus anguillicau